jgi:histidinol-phosphate/aromatic aminotransferase/cobyric acid decarboxylase-like protein
MTAPDLSAAPAPGAHGGDGARLAAVLGREPSDVLDLSASLNPVAPDLTSTFVRHLEALRRYPDPSLARDALADCIGVDPDLVVMTNGGSEAIALVAAELRDGWVEEPEFSLYRRHLRCVKPDAPRWRSNPNNPRGLLASDDDSADVWDEAFFPLATGTWTRGDIGNGSVVLGSLTKLLACPGLRVGYVLCPGPGLAERIRQRQPVWALNGLACAAVPDLLERVELRRWSREVADLRGALEGVLESAGLRPRRSDANWVLVDAPGLRDRLASHGILVRDCSNFGMPGTVRIAVPGPDGLERLEAAL